MKILCIIDIIDGKSYDTNEFKLYPYTQCIMHRSCFGPGKKFLQVSSSWRVKLVFVLYYKDSTPTNTAGETISSVAPVDKIFYAQACRRVLPDQKTG